MEIRIENLQKSYDKRCVLNVKNGIIRRGSRTAIIGPNGAGKSTLMKILAGIDTRDTGKVFYNDGIDFPRKDVTMVFQKPYLISSNVEKNIEYPMKIRGINDDERKKRAIALMEELNLLHLRQQKTWKLSGGEIQKVALARALSFGPKLLLLDEPTANIDPYTTAEIEKMLVSTENTTIVMVTHNLVQAKRMCDDIIVMHKGEFIEVGKTADVLKNPQNENARRFIEGEILI